MNSSASGNVIYYTTRVLKVRLDQHITYRVSRITKALHVFIAIAGYGATQGAKRDPGFCWVTDSGAGGGSISDGGAISDARTSGSFPREENTYYGQLSANTGGRSRYNVICY